MSAIRAYLKGLVEEAKKPTSSTLLLAELVPRPQPRRRFEEASLKALAESIRAHGVLEPLLVRPLGDGRYEIVAGERRYRAAQMAGLSEVPVVVLEGLDEKTAQAIALMENLQREDLNPYEETVAVLDLLALELSKSREEVISLLHRMWNEARGKSTRNVAGSPEAQRVEEVFRLLGRMDWSSFVRHRLPLLNLPPDLQEALLEGAIPYTAALELKKVKEEGERRKLLEEAKAGLSLRELKAKVRELLRKEASPPPWHKEVLARLSRLDLEALPPEKRKAVERHLQALAKELGLTRKA
ncbi:ParB/RepB/Spo0J family partition protein [Thermus tengchongensis]|uniref:ParB/RepB/Spo0J family partition protein n=1 Tax=Thermus tengchongensis TaxID=1214928 RepID=A0ABY2K339_9DEIN|nr:ParB/RepB/Spo0J family partition protein [Thermus tengchongensis]TFU14145.1 ParB/RepB/Spo0J family partition protein [Thermus tengchongensis]